MFDTFETPISSSENETADSQSYYYGSSCRPLWFTFTVKLAISR